MANEPSLVIDREDHVLTVTLNRPHAHNALDMEMLCRLADAWDLIDGDDEIRVAILTGAGGNFCSGSDLKQMHDPPDNEWSARMREHKDLHWKSFLRSYRLKKPIIAAVEGTAVAGGTEILQGTDIRIAGDTARFGLPEPRWGLFPLGGSTVRLRRQIPYAKAMDLLLTGRLIGAEEADRIGLITRVVPAGQALAAARETARMIADNGPLAVQAIKQSVMETESLPEADALARELELGWKVFGSEDAREGPRAFAEKRKPLFVRR